MHIENKSLACGESKQVDRMPRNGAESIHSKRVGQEIGGGGEGLVFYLVYVRVFEYFTIGMCLAFLV